MLWDKLFMTAVAVILLATGLQGLWRREFRPQRHWGEIGGPRAFAPIRGGKAVAAGIWLLACGAGLLAWTWGR